MIKPYYEQDGITIYHGDCRELIFDIGGTCDAILTDPPYGIKMDKGFEGFGGFGEPIARRQYVGGWDENRPNEEIFKRLMILRLPTFIFGGNFFADLLPKSTHWLVWDKRQTMPTFGDCELVWTNLDLKPVKIIMKEYNGLLGKEEQRVHATQKPLKIVGWIIEKYLAQQNNIFDPFMGSGTTLVAAKKLGKKATGIDIDEQNCAIAVKRLGQGVLDL
jgi:DNA modification methylase